MERILLGWAAVIGAWALIFILSGCQVSQAWQDQSDQAELRRLFSIPGLELQEYHGFPAVSGFGQREGLTVSAIFRLTDAQIADFERQATQSNWSPLPIPASLRQKILWKELPVPLDAQMGYYYCRTAGDNVLHATRTSSCADQAPEHDIILGILDRPTARLSVVVRSGY